MIQVLIENFFQTNIKTNYDLLSLIFSKFKKNKFQGIQLTGSKGANFVTIIFKR